IALKDMAGVGRPTMLGKLVHGIKTKYPHIKVQYHGHTGPGFSVASMLEVARAGVDIVDVAMEPLSWGMVHPDVITIQEMYREAGFEVKNINMKAYMEARSMTQSFIDDYLGYFIDKGNKVMTSLLVGCGLPGGMMGSMMADLKGFHNAINMSLRNQGKKELTLDGLVTMLFQEVEYVWPKLGYPPLVTPFSQYVKNIALMNLMHLLKGEERWKTIDKNAWDMILGSTGKLPGPLAPEIIALAKEQGKEFFTGNPQDEYPNALDEYRKEMKENNWDFGQDDEELFELAMHDRQYRDYKSGVAKERFQKELEDAREKANAPIVTVRPVVEMPRMDVNKVIEQYPNAQPVQATAKGQVIWEYAVAGDSKEPPVGTKVKDGENVCFIQTYYGMEPVNALASGKLVVVAAKQGSLVEKNEIIGFIA
ncbi:MAG: oxaloacetate decarboxylase, partial [Bacteroidales bacterium]